MTIAAALALGAEGVWTGTIWLGTRESGLTPFEKDAVFAARLLGFDGGTNFQDPHHPEDQRKNVLLMPQRLEAAAKESSIDAAAFGERWASVQSRLLEARTKRKQPHLDDKVITSWNGLMIGAMASAGAMLKQPRFIAAAERAAESLLRRLRHAAPAARKPPRLQRPQRQGARRLDS